MEKIGYILIGLMGLATLVYGFIVAINSISAVIQTFGGSL